MILVHTHSEATRFLSFQITCCAIIMNDPSSRLHTLVLLNYFWMLWNCPVPANDNHIPTTSHKKLFSSHFQYYVLFGYVKIYIHATTQSNTSNNTIYLSTWSQNTTQYI